jgi:hypothetical protein
MSIRADATVCSRGSSKGRGISSSMSPKRKLGF